MIDFVLQRCCEQPLRFELLRLAVPVLISDPHQPRPVDLDAHIRDRQTAFIVGAHGVAAGQNARVDQRQGPRLLVFARHVENQQTARNPDLDGCEANAGSVVHGLEHIVDQPTQVRVEALDRSRDGAQQGIRQGDDR